MYVATIKTSVTIIHFAFVSSSLFKTYNIFTGHGKLLSVFIVGMYYMVQLLGISMVIWVMATLSRPTLKIPTRIVYAYTALRQVWDAAVYRPPQRILERLLHHLPRLTNPCPHVGRTRPNFLV